VLAEARNAEINDPEAMALATADVEWAAIGT
jgi:pyridoxine/pyridoxamine 5'-phosphate oxidase